MSKTKKNNILGFARYIIPPTTYTSWPPSSSQHHTLISLAHTRTPPPPNPRFFFFIFLLRFVSYYPAPPHNILYYIYPRPSPPTCTLRTYGQGCSCRRRPWTASSISWGGRGSAPSACWRRPTAGDADAATATTTAPASPRRRRSTATSAPSGTPSRPPRAGTGWGVTTTR